MMIRILMIFLLTISSSKAVCAFPLLEYGGHFYTHVTKEYTWDAARNHAMSIGGYLAVPDNFDENEWFRTNGWREDWIGIYDPNKIENYCTTGVESCMADDSRFRTVKGGPLPFRYWEANEPNNLVLPEDYDVNGDPLVSPVGEYWVLIGANGRWGDYGNHANSYQPIFTTSSIVEFDRAPSCHSTSDEEIDEPPEIFCIADYNGDQQAQEDEIKSCTAAMTGHICDADMLQCEPEYIDANCTMGGVLDGSRDMCQIDGSITCPVGFTFDPSSDLCFKDVECFASGSLDPTSGECRSDWRAECPTGYSLVADICRDEPICPTGTTYNNTRNRCERPANSACPTGTTYDASSGHCQYSATSNRLCRAVVDAPGSDCLNGSGYCYGLPGGSCGTNRLDAWAKTYCSSRTMTYLQGDAKYTTGTVWGEKSFYPTFDSDCHPTNPKNVFYWSDQNGAVAESITTSRSTYYTCPKGGSLSGTTCKIAPDCASSTAPYRDGSVCYNSASCLGAGTLSLSTDKCEVDHQIKCPAGSTYDDVLGLCSHSVDCSPGSLDENTSRCIIPDTIDEDTCPDGYSYTPSPIGKCEAVPLCEHGSYVADATSLPMPYNNTIEHTSIDRCYLGDDICPHGDSHACMSVPTMNNFDYCSPWSCTDESGISYNGAPVGASDKNDLGVIDEEGCHGQVYIFNGQDYRCRASDAFLGLDGGGCCDKEKVFLGLVQCDEAEVALSMKRNNSLCHEIGPYCSKEVELGLTDVCVQTTQSHCCFGSVLGRIMQEQARAQLNIPWGDPENPECRGFMPEEFEKIDFAQMDMTEFEQSISYAGGEMDTSSDLYEETKDGISQKVHNLLP